MSTSAKVLGLMGRIQEALDKADMTTADKELAPLARVVVDGLRTGDHDSACDAAEQMLAVIAAKSKPKTEKELASSS